LDGKQVSNNAEIDDYRWLVDSEAAKWLAEAAAEAARPGFSPVRLAARLRETLSPGRTRLVLEQAELRGRGREKFARAESMFFSRISLEQATDELLATYKSGRFPAEVPVADLCCGIGGDAMALAGRERLTAIERDPAVVIFAKANLKVFPAASVANHEIDSIAIDKLHLRDFGAWHIDPDRRPDGRRTTKVELYEPGVETIRALLSTNPNAAVKLAPAADFSETWWQDAELEWIGRGRQCRQLVAWFGALAQYTGQRRATIISGQIGQPPQVAGSFVGEPEVECAIADKIGRYVFEPDAAVLAAKLEGSLARKHGMSAIAGGVAYFTADELIADGALTAFEVLETMPYDVKRVKAWLSQRRFGRLEVKKRGVPLEPEQVRRNLQNSGEEAATILLARIKGQITAIVSRRIPTTSVL
jgi:hypothetical protein